jgi:ABC-type glycerol-3-phosphate transport system substrate-binding protein
MVDAIEAALNDGRSLDVLYISNPELLIGLDELDLLMPVDEVSRSDSEFDFADYFPAAVQAVTLGGRAVGLPLWLRPMTVRVNLEAFDEARVDVPSGSWDWQSFAETAARLTVRSGDQVDRYGFVVSPTDTPAFSFMWQNGADILLQNSGQAGITRPAAIEAVQFMSDLVHVHGVAPVLRAGENAESLAPSFRSNGIFVGGTPVAMAPYAFGKSLGMQVNTTRSQRGNQVEITVDVIMPADESGNPVVGSSGDGSGTANLPTQKAESNLARPGGSLVVLSTSQLPEDAWAVVRQLGEELEPMGTVPARRLTAAQLMEIDTTLKLEEAESVIAAAAVARVPVLPHRDEVLTILRDEVDEPALEGAANEIEKLLAG